MAKTKRYTNNDLFKSAHRDRLKAEGNVHLPSNKVQIPLTMYKRIKFHKDLDCYFLDL